MILQTALNSSSNDAPFMVKLNYSGRSMLLLTQNLSFDSSKEHCVATATVSGNYTDTQNVASLPFAYRARGYCPMTGFVAKRHFAYHWVN